jgi:hypothetical protein
VLFHSIHFGGDKEIRNKFIEISFQRKFIHLQRENGGETGLEGESVICASLKWKLKGN